MWLREQNLIKYVQQTYGGMLSRMKLKFNFSDISHQPCMLLPTLTPLSPIIRGFEITLFLQLIFTNKAHVFKSRGWICAILFSPTELTIQEFS